MSPLAAAHTRLACAPPTSRDAARCALSLTGLGARQGRAMVRSLASCLFVGRRHAESLDVGAALSGGARDDGGDLVRLGGPR